MYKSNDDIPSLPKSDVTSNRVARQEIIILGCLLILFIAIVSFPVSAVEMKLSENTARHIFPAISGNYVVWMDINEGYGIWMYDIQARSLKRISRDSDSVKEPAISEDRIVWVDLSNGGTGDYNAIYLYNITENRITQLPGHPLHPGQTGFHDQWSPAISGNFVVYWMYPHEIWAYNIVSGDRTLISASADNVWKERPRIWGTQIVWSDNRNGNYDIWLYTLATGGPELQISSSPNDERNPDIWSDRVVWQEEDTTLYGEPGDIIFYNITSKVTTRITNDNAAQSNPAIFGNWIVWDDDRDYQERGLEVYRYNLSSRVTDLISTFKSKYAITQSDLPDVSGNFIVWEDNRPDDGSGDWDIYLYTDQDFIPPEVGTNQYNTPSLPAAVTTKTPLSIITPFAAIGLVYLMVILSQKRG